MTRLWLPVTVGGALAGLAAPGARGQGGANDLSASPVACHGEVVSRIDVHSNPPFAPGGPRIVSQITALATSLHATTRERVIRRYLTVQVGAPCSEARRLESERILRAQPYLAAAKVIAYPDGSGGVIIDVTTVDEVSLVLDGDGALKAPLVRGIRVGDANLAGEAIYLAGGWQHSPFYRDAYRARLTDYQFLGHPYQLALQGVRNELGGSWESEVSYPFLTQLQRNAWRVTVGNVERYLTFVRPVSGTSPVGLMGPALQSERAYGDVGGVHAFGPVRRRVLLGGSFSHERERTASDPVIILDSEILRDTSSALRGRYGAHQTSRLNLLLGYRTVEFLPVSGFDAVEGTQDVRTGIQVATLLGKGIKLSKQDEPDYFLSGDVYAGTGTPTSFFAFETLGERRLNMDARRWDGILGSGRAAWYVKPSAGHTVVSDLEFGGGWRQRVPFQLTFADREGGLRGYNASRLGGAQRLVARVEDRHRLGHLRQFAALSAAGFVDAGKIWAGDAPFGTTTGVKYSAGVSLLAALPPNSRRTWRVDFAQPLNDRHDAKFELRVSNQDLTRWFWREPGDVQIGRERSIPNSVYNWP